MEEDRSIEGTRLSASPPPDSRDGPDDDTTIPSFNHEEEEVLRSGLDPIPQDNREVSDAPECLNSTQDTRIPSSIQDDRLTREQSNSSPTAESKTKDTEPPSLPPHTPPANVPRDAYLNPHINSSSPVVNQPGLLRTNGHADRAAPTHASEPSPHRRSMTMSSGHTVSIVLISTALETIAVSREAKRIQPLRESTQRALELIRNNEAGDHQREIFEPLQQACETKNEKLMIASLDCISKLISYSFFAESPSHETHVLPSPPPSPHPNMSGRHSTGSTSQSNIQQPSLVDLIAHTITACHTETTPEPVSLQIVKALLALVLSPTIFIHHSSLLKAVRTVYNVFLLSTDPVNQMVAQGGLTQMVHHVFTRCKVGVGLVVPSATTSLGVKGDGSGEVTNPLTVENMLEEQVPAAVHVDQVGAVTIPPKMETLSLRSDIMADGSEHPDPSSPVVDLPIYPTSRGHIMTPNDLFIKDAFLVFRALCKLTMKPLNTESERDLRSHATRSKLLSLHLVLTVLNSHMPLFVDPHAIIYSSSSNEATTFIQAVNQYLCLCLSRNAVSPVPQVFEISVEIFWRVISGMRTKLKKEIEVLLHEIFIPILEMKNSSLKQKAIILGMLSRLCQDPQALVEIYLNYDCDGNAVDNIYERLMNIISKISSASIAPGHHRTSEPPSPALNPTKHSQNNPIQPSSSTGALSVPGSMDTANLGTSESQLKRQGLECLVMALRSLVAWGTSPGKPSEDGGTPTRSQHEDSRRDSFAPDGSLDRLSVVDISAEALRQSSPDLIDDDPSRFESAKQKKTTLLEGIKKFNFKPKRGVLFLLENGLIRSKSPLDIAQFLLITDGLSKAMIGEYLGEGDEENIAIMHAFVDQMELSNLAFVDALRLFLQSFRLPGEAQKIDRFMLKFAERYIAGNPRAFANADTAYVLAYSVIMLNTDAHSPQIKKRMTKAEFIKNNRGINDNESLPDDYLTEIYDGIVSNEIRMKDEIEAAAGTTSGAQSLAAALTNVGRDPQREAYLMQSNGMANKTEAIFRTLMKTQRKGTKPNDQFFSASHFVHVRPMFEVAWIPFLASLSGPLQDTDDLEIVELCLDGFKNAIRIVCFFDLELQRNAFLTTLAKFTFLNNLGEMKTKNMEAIKTLLDVAVTEGNNLKGSWHEVLTCVSQLEQMQLISSGLDLSDPMKKGRMRKLPTEELANESRSAHITVATDMVFSLSRFLSGTAIVDFVQALSDVSWEEIQSSGLSQQPRLFSLQKLVEISYYNMNRIRLEWSNLWDILGEHFNKVCCHSNPHVGFFALDSLRQLAMRFLEKEELLHFKFQKDFLKPFEYTMIHNQNPEIRELVLQCLQQMIQARDQNMRSGWQAMFGVFSAASKVLTEKIVTSAFEIVTRLSKEHFSAIVRHGAFAELIRCITEFCKVSKYQKISLLAIAMLRGIIPVMLESPDYISMANSEKGTVMDKEVLAAFHNIIMNGEDLEVRRLALDSLFTTLKTHGTTYPIEFWNTVCAGYLFPIFAVLKSRQDLSRFSTQEDMSVWLSTTMIQALRDLIDLYTFYFDILERFLDNLLDLLCVCICQENDTLARIGTSCLQQLLENNVKKLSSSRWERVTFTFVRLFRTTTPHELFDEELRVEIDGSVEAASDSMESNGQTILPAPLSPTSDQPRETQRNPLAERQRVFRQIIVKCVLQLLLIETTNDLLRNQEVYITIPPQQLLQLMGVLDQSYQFARSFNEDKELRTGLWKVGFMKHLPNLLKQESNSASTLVHVLLQMYYDARPEHQAARPQIAGRLLPLSLAVLRDFNRLRTETQSKNIAAWTPVVAEILDGFCRFDDNEFLNWLSAIYPLATDLLSKEVPAQIRQHLRVYFVRVGVLRGITER